LEALENAQRARASDTKSAHISRRTDEARPDDERLWNLVVDPCTDPAADWQNQKVQTTPSYQLAFFANLKNRSAANNKNSTPLTIRNFHARTSTLYKPRGTHPPTRLMAR